MDTHTRTHRQATASLTLLALGVVFGDIGTSPLYAAKETFDPAHGIPLTPANILGGASAIFWSLMVVVSLKYVTLILRATNRGEGGIMALLSLVVSAVRERPRTRAALIATGVFGASLFYGDAVLTPAISVLSAVEGLEVGTPLFKPYVVPIALGVLVALFAVQRYGTGVVGIVFGPVCALWFAAIGAVGAWNVMQRPAVLAALDPQYAVAFLASHGAASFVVLGSVLLAFTGAEALYADVGHFGARAIRIGWFAIAAPALVLNYFGQAGLLLADPAAVDNPFYLACPAWALYPMVALATAATVIASQATISGTYSLTRQAVQLGYLPRLSILHTSARTMGQVYVPAVNWLLLAAVLAAVAGFGSSSRLASAYGVAVTGTMLATTILTYFVLRYAWHYPAWLCLAVTGAFVAVDAIFFASALHKVLDGGWFPLALAAIVFVVMTTWRRGRAELGKRLAAAAPPLVPFLRSLLALPPQRIAGTAVFLTSKADATPSALLHSLKHYKVLHARNVFLTVVFRDEPFVPDRDRIESARIAEDAWRVTASYGFMERPDVVRALELWRPDDGALDPMEVTYFLSREKLVPRGGRRRPRWRDAMFAAMARNASSLPDFFNVPSGQVVELGSRVEI